MSRKIDPALQARFDEMLMGICSQAGDGIHGLLDSVFSFLQRRTDYYYEAEPGDKMGFPPKFAEGLVSSILTHILGLLILQKVPRWTWEEVPPKRWSTQQAMGPI